ncbi:efflux RND transporter permease subunit [Mesorhizobium sp. M1A.F.Ca.IN.020.06.1.1]|uniref:efflux RND transporter permease subunit n=1 Tax=unclassified Mesorhizobium TaxID=325217 RepID=UPI000FD328B6|nr:MULTISPECIES: efflux RND transporter permease subunit [unclassified Mesorhizobium]RUV06389.1 efflux RND transporter permease subunit [Mesorhizobium sp. M1A.F.Ca.IN.020.03.2.1]RUV90194.1 efflux RND transporter permease subunit [Mesorhizobium sp. M1A.F.Ca.IN.020.32.1.1]RUW35154.1 efflux RND transporter permease subunit [Mesorhizobium sp. M1A.F.Ca.IN.020.06.1.1]RWH07007.1 MAG: efflux RND transporter permease subunit [Mesorhizobium sp.]TIS38881.1 MAG: efflux RND transporter permease subunit [Me
MSAAGDQTAGSGLTALFIRRPVMAFVLNTLIAVAGLAAFWGVEIRELPDVDRPVITVNTTFEGAAAETVDRELTDPIEGAVARVSGVKSISSTSSFGQSRVTIEFSDGVDLNVAASDVRDSVSRITNQLPETADAPRIVKADANSDPVMRLAVTSDTMSVQDMTVLVQDRIEDELAAVPGVADVQVSGGRDKIFRIDVDQNKLASHGFTVADLRKALASVAFDSPAGSITTTNQDLVVRTTADVTTPEEFESIVIGGATRIRDVATVTLGPDIGQTSLRSDGKTGIGLGIIRQAESNTLDISTGVRAAVEKLQANLPQGMSIKVTSDDAVFVNGAVHEVEIALALSVSIVLIVIYAFLLDWRATLIPGLSMPVAMIGTIAAIYLAGFSINILTLLALVLATGLVVDDAIVVLENIVRRRNEGMGPRAAAVLGTQEVFFAVVATTLTLVAVFVPISFLPGQTGGLFREFGFVLAMSVLLSCVVALTLCPMLASRMLTSASLHHEGGSGVGARIGGALHRLYKRCLHACLGAPWIVVLVAMLFAGTAFTLFGTIRQELTPTEDRAVVLLRINAPQGVSLDYTTEQMRKIERLIQPLRDSGEIRSTFANAGNNGAYNSGFMVMTLAPWAERTRSQQEIMAEISRLTKQVPSVRVFPVQPNSLRIRGAGSGLQFALVGNDRKALSAAAVQIVEEMRQDPRFQSPRLSVDLTQPQLAVAIDRERASDLGIDITGLADTLQAMLDGNDVVDVYIADRSYGVKLVSTTNPINDPTDLENIFLKTSDGRFVPMSTIATLTERAVPPSLTREQQQPSVAITASLGGSFALGDALTRAEEIATPLLPLDARIVPLAEAATLGESNSAMATIFGFALVIILLVLAAQFESFVSAVIIMATVPLGLACAIFALLLSGTSLNAYSQIGLVLLVGVMAKNGILIVEFANQLRDRGLGVREAIEEAATIRLRPVMMTMICTVLGGVPLVLASGAGAEARVALGWVIVGGLGLATVSTLFLTPVAYLLLGRFVTPKAHEEARVKRELEQAAYANVEPAE